MLQAFGRCRGVVARCLCALSLLMSLPAVAGIPDQMKQMIEQKRAEDAYQLGLKHPELLGETYFDYIFGTAAVDAGRPSVGVLALERVLLNNPNNDVARLELARAYFVLGEYQRSREEFETVKQHNPPPGAVVTINQYLDAIKEKESATKISGGVFAEIGGGWNSNVNTAAAINNLILPIFGPVQLADGSKPQSSGFSYYSAGGQVNVPITRDVVTFANVNASSQRYAQYSGYDLQVANASVGTKVADGPNLYKIIAYGSIPKQDQIPVPTTGGGGAEYNRQLSDSQSVSVGYGYSNLAYDQQYSAYNANMNAGTLGYRQMMSSWPGKPVFDLVGNLARLASTANRPDLTRNIGGGGLQLSFLPADKWGVSTGVAYAQYDYDGQDLLFLQGRTDNLYSANGVIQYKLGDGWSTRMELTYYNNQSNLQLYTYQQFTGSLKLRYDWDSR